MAGGVLNCSQWSPSGDPPTCSESKTEIVDLTDPSKACLLDVHDAIPQRKHSVGGLLGTTPVICGCYWMDCDCVLLGTSQVITMNNKRSGASSVAINGNKMWILGGYGNDYSIIYDSTEFITLNGAEMGPKLPESVAFSCAVKFPETGDIYLIGGDTGGPDGRIKNVWVASPSNEYASFSQGPSLMTARYYHSCGTMSIGARNIIVVAGNRGGAGSPVEILDPLSLTNQWIGGK